MAIAAIFDGKMVCPVNRNHASVNGFVAVVAAAFVAFVVAPVVAPVVALAVAFTVFCAEPEPSVEAFDAA